MPTREREKTDTIETALIDELKAYEGFLQIDKNDLDNVVIQQPELYAKVSAFYIRALDLKDRADQNYKEVKARADQEIRSGSEKVTETQITQRLELDPDVKEARKTFLSWKRTAGLWEALKEAYEQRGYAINKLTELWIAGYYGETTGRSERTNSRARLGQEGREAMHRAREERYRE